MSHLCKNKIVRNKDLSPCQLLGPDSKKVIKLARSQLPYLYYREDDTYGPRIVYLPESVL